MVNGFEHKPIKARKLPLSWQEEGALEELEKLLQSNWEQRSIFYSDGEVTSRQQFIDFERRDGIKLKNYIGTIIFRGEQLNIFPKVFKEDEDDSDTDELEIDELINNLVLWLGYCDRLNFPFVSMKSELDSSANLMELFITVYVHYVKAAIDRQLFFRYEEITETGSFVKGKVDFRDYAMHKYPTGQHHRMDYTYSSFVFDNLMNRIIKCTCILLFGLTKQPSSKTVIRYILMKLGDVSPVNCLPHDCDSLKLNALQSNYRIILSMSKMFLLNSVASGTHGSTETFCFLFPAELLFEGFIGGYLKEMLRGEARVSTQTSDQYLAELVVNGETRRNVFQLREDILIENANGIVVLDTKYKEIDRFEQMKDNPKLGVSDGDIKQMAIYAAKRGAKKLYLLYPLHRDEEPETIEIHYNINLGREFGERKIPLHILKVPFAFAEDEEATRALLKRILIEVPA